jgi:hypothetical protein
MKASSLPVPFLRKYLAGLIRTQRNAIRRFPVSTNLDVFRREKMQAELKMARFIATDIRYFAANPADYGL